MCIVKKKKKAAPISTEETQKKKKSSSKNEPTKRACEVNVESKLNKKENVEKVLIRNESKEKVNAKPVVKPLNEKASKETQKTSFMLTARNEDHMEENSQTKSNFVTRTEHLENAQLTGIQTIDLKAAFSKPLTVGFENDDNSCKDTIEDVTSDMEDMVFACLLNSPAGERERPFVKTPTSEKVVRIEKKLSANHLPKETNDKSLKKIGHAEKVAIKH